MKDKNVNLDSEYDTTIALLNVYLSEYIYRDQVLWSNLFKMYYVVLIVILLPNLTNYFQIELPNIPIIIFRLIGLLLSFVFLYITLGFAIRVQAIVDTYQQIIDKLPNDYQRKKIKTIPSGKLFSLKMSYIACFIFFLSLFVLSIIFMII